MPLERVNLFSMNGRRYAFQPFKRIMQVVRRNILQVVRNGLMFFNKQMTKPFANGKPLVYVFLWGHKFSFEIEISVINNRECFCQQLWTIILVNANYFKGVFASFSSLVKESAEFPCNKETSHTCRLNTFFVVLNFFWGGFLNFLV